MPKYLSLEEIYKNEYDNLLRFSRMYFKDYDDCEDVLQEVIVDMFIRTGMTSMPLCYIRGGIINKFKMKCRSDLVKKKYVEYKFRKQEYSMPEVTYNDLVHKIQSILIDEKAIARRDIFMMSVFGGFKLNEIATIKGIKEQVVRNQICTIKKEIRKKLVNYK